MNDILQDVFSEITHKVIEGKVRHVIYRTVVYVNNANLEGLEADFILQSSESRKIRHDEFDGYFSGRLYTNVYMKILD